MSSPILVVGSYVCDLCFSMPEFPRPGQTLIGKFKSGPGGKGSNQAVAAARTGTETAFIGATGDDAFAQVARSFHKEEGIISHLASYPDLATGTAAILVNERGENEIVVALGANNALSSGDIQDQLIIDAKILVTQLECNLEATMHALKLGRNNGIKTLLNPAPMRNDFSLDILQWVDILIPNETEFAHLARLRFPDIHGDFSEDSIAELSQSDLHSLCRKFGVSTFIITLGSQGCFISTPDKFFTVPSISGIKVVDTTGAGDTFVGGFASGLVQFENNIEKAAQYGNIVAGLSVTQFGTAPAMPSKADIKAELGRQSLSL